MAYVVSDTRFPLCIDCKHHSVVVRDAAWSEHMCDAVVNLVTGEKLPRVCFDMRNWETDGGVQSCGPLGKRFEPRVN